MFGKKSHVSPLELRKQLLIAESDLNRAQLAQDMAELTAGLRAFTDRAKSFGSIASSAAVLVAGLAALKHRKSAAPEAKPSWLQTILKGVSVISGLWLAFRSSGGRTDA
jgi:hypothetical protein